MLLIGWPLQCGSLKPWLLLISCAFDQGQRKRLFFLTFFNIICSYCLPRFHRYLHLWRLEHAGASFPEKVKASTTTNPLGCAPPPPAQCLSGRGQGGIWRQRLFPAKAQALNVWVAKSSGHAPCIKSACFLSTIYSTGKPEFLLLHWEEFRFLTTRFQCAGKLN